MEIQIEPFRQTLLTLKPFVALSPAIPTAEGRIYLGNGMACATGIEAGVSISYLEAQEPMVLPFIPLLEFLEFSTGTAIIQLDHTRGQVSVTTSDGAEMTATSPPAEEYPLFKEFIPLEQHDVDGGIFTRQLLEASSCCDSEDGRQPVLQGVNIIMGNQVKLVAADGFRLMVVTLPFSLGTSGNILIPKASVVKLAALWESAPSLTMHISIDKGMMTAKFGQARFHTALIPGTFPDYTKIVPEDNPQVVQFLAEDLQIAIKRIGHLSETYARFKWALFDTHDGQLQISCRGDELASAKLSVPCHVLYRGERQKHESLEGKVALNLNYLKQYLHGKMGVITMEVKTRSDAVLFRQSEPPDQVMVVMPMMVRWE